MPQPTTPDYLLGYSPHSLRIHPLGAPSPTAGERWAATRARRRLMEGVWHYDLYLWAQQERDPALLLAMGNLDLSECLYRSVVEQVAVLYQSAPILTHEGEIPQAVHEDAKKLFRAHQRLNRATMAHGEAAIVLDLLPKSAWDDTPAAIGPCVALPDEIDAEPVAEGSRELAVFWRATRRRIDNVLTWCWDHWDLTGPSPVYTVRRADQSEVPKLRLEGKDYLWRYENGEPFIPAVLYHAEEGSDLWSPFRWPELARATLETAMSWSDWRESLRNASFALRYLMDAQVSGASDGDGESGHKRIPIAPNVLLPLTSKGSQAGQAGVLSAPIDVLKHAQAIQLRHKLRATSIGLHPSEIESGSSPESGVALTIRREGQRRAQREQEPAFRLGDLELLRKWSDLRAKLGLETVPGTGWGIQYTDLPESAAEGGNRRLDEVHDLTQGLTSRARILAARERLSLDQAERLAATIQEELEKEAGEREADKPFDAARAASLLAIVRSLKAGEISPQQATTVLQVLLDLDGAALAGLVTIDPKAPIVPLNPSPVVVLPTDALPLEPPPGSGGRHGEHVGVLTWGGMRICVEVAAGQVRSGVNPQGSPWSVLLPWHYGEIADTMGLDGEPIDAIVGPLVESEVYVATILDSQGEPDEEKALLGFGSEDAARGALAAFYPGMDIVRDVRAESLVAFRQRVLVCEES